ncbi:MAG: hypothetical protein COZ31_10405 [Nitrospirae bacterium CG_4_10_14_3_um_filter_44_29]|nr:MAG: hypothetical protein AUJ60_03055 [Nitrospirae bacterium CG1_02_44_142]PIP71218.1 MAG: hypothetical protein COW90_01165 [Nitrospirae bacterium CG22_combo_CG10-13_8_21_14_all_44_11]PIV40401.1 MAG: hypothetical protein COS28_09070 [Nitrospirae bacterium CG02_land_8_20_14_3_00_44_33]PIV67243.1 MAG: hypothetical protein COS10_02165 [Nitrospirae bacterium CG01_land_8_20_14_3_00_44_22]PIW90439.1 MAG: hypothetical protein COZ93_01425 [Nitrospirae bacterium CG_4_8_14_3_um_filter_44_28]PIX87395.
MAKLKQIQQITQFLSAYPKDVVGLGIEAWRTGEMPVKEDSRFKIQDLRFNRGNGVKCPSCSKLQ